MAKQEPKYKIGDTVYILDSDISTMESHLPEIYIYKIQGVRVITESTQPNGTMRFPSTGRKRTRVCTTIEYWIGRGKWIEESRVFPSQKAILEYIVNAIHINDRSDYRGA